MLLIEVRKDLWLEVSIRKRGINYEETLTPGSKVHDEVKTSLPQWYDQGRVFHRIVTRI